MEKYQSLLCVQESCQPVITAELVTRYQQLVRQHGAGFWWTPSRPRSSPSRRPRAWTNGAYSVQDLGVGQTDQLEKQVTMMLVFISAGITECSWVAAGSSPLLWQQPAGVHKDCETREPQPAGDQQLKIQKSRPPCSPLTTWRASPYGAKLPLPSEAASYNSSSIKVIFVTPTYLP